MITIARLTTVPVKALAAVPRQTVRIDPDGVPDDRRAFLLRADGSVLTLRQCPRLALLVPDLDLEAGTLAVSGPDGVRACSELGSVTDEVEATLFGKHRQGRVLPGEVAELVSHTAGEPVRVVVAERTGVGHDEGPVSLPASASSAAMGTEDSTRFRMLVEVEGTAAHDEDGWVGREVTLGEAVLRVSHPLERCIVIEGNPQTGERDWKGLKALASAGRDRLTLGVIADVVRAGSVRVGDAVEVG